MEYSSIFRYKELNIYIHQSGDYIDEIRSLTEEEAKAIRSLTEEEVKAIQSLTEKEANEIKSNTEETDSKRRVEELASGTSEEITSLLEKCKSELKEYFDGRRKVFDLPLKMNGTEFQKKVWDKIARIEYGSTKTYGEIAKEIGNEKVARAVGMAANKNPIQFVVPCHRVIGKNNKLVGYAGGLELKKNLLEMEEYGTRIHKINT